MERATEALWKPQYLPTEDKHVDSLLCLLLIRGAGKAGRHRKKYYLGSKMMHTGDQTLAFYPPNFPSAQT